MGGDRTTGSTKTTTPWQQPYNASYWANLEYSINLQAKSLTDQFMDCDNNNTNFSVE